MIQQTIDELNIKYYRRIFDPMVTIWAFLSQILDAEKSCHNAVSRVIAWLSTENVEFPSTDTSAYCQARLRLPEKLLEKLAFFSGEKLEEQCTSEQLWCGRHVKIIDTSTVILTVSHTKILKIYRSLLKIIIHKVVPSRPNRVEPRKVKRRPKAYPLMKEPRVEARKKLLAG